MPILPLFMRLITTTLYFCFAAFVKSYETTLIKHLEMDPLTRLVFDLLHAALLTAFSVELLNLLWKDVRDDLVGDHRSLSPSLSPFLPAKIKLQKLLAILKQSSSRMWVWVRALRRTKEPGPF